MSQGEHESRAGLATVVTAEEPMRGVQAAAGLDGILDATPRSIDRTPRRNAVAVLLLALGIGFGTLMPAFVALPVVVARIAPESKDIVLGTLLSVQALAGIALAPFFGALSDRTTSRFGMRRPGIAIGGMLVVVGLSILAFADSVPALFAGGVTTALGSTVSGASSFAVIPDSFPDRSRGRILGFKALTATLAGLLASIIGPMLLGNQVALFGVGAVVLAICFLIAVPLLQDRRLDKFERADQSLLSAAFSGYRYNPKSAPDFSWVFVSRFVFTLGISFSTTFAVYFMTDQLMVTPEALPALIGINSVITLAGTALGTLVGAFLADKVPSRKLMVLICGVILGVGAVVVACSDTPTVFLLGTSLLAFAVGVFIPTDGALVMSVLPGGDKHAAKYMAIIGIADQLPRSIGSAVAPAIIALGALTALGGYQVLYLAGAAAAIAGGVVVRMVRGAR
jgi:MFS family permease